jgi:transcriptional regulator with XRE-family HTH domain
MRQVEPDRLSRDLAEDLEAARLTAETLSRRAGLARDTVGRWIRGTTVPTLASLRAAEEVLSSRLGYAVDLSAAVRERRAARRAAGWTATGGPRQEYLNNLIEHPDEAARELARIENDREHDRMRPVLEGRILPWPGRSDGRDHRLEIRVKTHWPLALILLNVPGDAWFTSTVHMPPAGMDFLIQFPEPGRTSAPFRPGHPASCPVRVAASARGTVTAFATCRNEHGRTWENVEVTITLDRAMRGTSADTVPGADNGSAQDQ